MRLQPPVLLITLLCLLLSTGASAGDYYPPPGHWQRQAPEQLGFDPARLAAAVAGARDRGVVEPRELSEALQESYRKEPGYRILGPTGRREAPAGLVIRHGRIAAEWGDPERVEMTFSVVKSFLSTVAGLAWQAGRVPDLDEPVGRRVRSGQFESAHNRPISWRHLLNQTSDWQGVLWGIEDWADRPVGDDPQQWANRELHAPGSHFKYNDVRVNLLAYALLQVWRKPLPVVLREQVMDPIGASVTWRWEGYENSWVVLDGQHMQSVSGGGHFGGGLFISSLDLARFGLLMLRNGRWGETQLVPEAWLRMAREPTPVKPAYGFMWWLNTGRQSIPAAPESAYYAAGYGGNYVYIDPDNDLLVVLRWTPALADVITDILAALDDATGAAES